MSKDAARPTGVGLGLRWEFLEEVMEAEALPVAFFEVSPENYMRRGGYFPASLAAIRARYPIVTHGLTLSIGSAEGPHREYLRELAEELRRLQPPWHSDHLCFASAGRRALHDLFPLPFCEASLRRVSERAREVQDRLGLPFALENISYYATPVEPGMSEAEFVARTIEAAGVGLLLDVNNVFVNAQNHGADPLDFLRQMPLERVSEIHVAGHAAPRDGLVLDTHSTPVSSEVHQLLEWVLERTGPVPVLLERDNDVPELAELLREVALLRAIYERAVRRFEEKQAPLPCFQVNSEQTPRTRSASLSEIRSSSALPSVGRSSAAPSQQALELAVAELVFAEPAPAAPAIFAESALRPERPLVYRKLVRNTLRDALALAIPRTIARLGPLFDACFAAFLAEREFSSHYLRDVTRDFIAYFSSLAARDPRIAPYLPDLARLEALHIEIAAAPERAPAVERPALSLDSTLAFISAARLVRFGFAVHELSEALSDERSPASRVTHLLAYRSPDHNVRYLELTTLAAALLERLFAGASLRAALAMASEQSGHAVDDSVLESTARLLADLSERGVLLGPEPVAGNDSSPATEQATLSAGLAGEGSAGRREDHD